MTRRRRLILMIGALVTVAVVTVALVVALRPGHAARRAPVAAPSSPAPSTTAPSTTAPSPSTSTPPKPPAIQTVAASAPNRFVMTGPAGGPQFRVIAHVCGMANVRPLDPPGEQHHTVCWVKQDFGVAPGSHSATTYVLGHSWAEDEQEVLNPASIPATKQILQVAKRRASTSLDGVRIYPTTVLDGSTITLRTRTGTLTYTVRQVYGVAKSEAGNIASLMNEKTPNRLVVITCAEANGTDYDYDIIVNAYLTKAVPNATTTQVEAAGR